MTTFRCEKTLALPRMTLRGNSHTLLELRSRFQFTHFSLDFDESLPEGLLQVSEDLFEELRQYLQSQSELLETL